MVFDIIPVGDNPILLDAFAAYGVKASLKNETRVPRFYQSERRLVSPAENLFAARGVNEFWIARQGKKVVGRIGAMIDRELFLKRETYKCGFVGLYEADRNPDIADSLLQTASEYLRDNDCEMIIGPMDFTIYHGYRFQANEFDSPCHIGEPRNPNYYITHFLAHGFEPYLSWHSHQLSLERVDELLADMNTDYRRLSELGYRLSPFEQFGDHRALDMLWELMQESYKKMPGFVNISKEDFRRYFSSLIPVTDMKSSMFLSNPAGEVIGFGVTFGDKVKALRAMRGSTAWWAKIQYFLRKNTGHLAIAYQTGVKYPEIKKALVAGLRNYNQPLSLAKAIYYACGTAIRQNPRYKEVIIALLRSDTPNIHLTKSESSKIRRYELLAKRL